MSRLSAQNLKSGIKYALLSDTRRFKMCEFCTSKEIIKLVSKRNEFYIKVQIQNEKVDLI